LWARVAGVSAREQLYVEYSKDQFASLSVDKDVEPDLYSFIEDVKETLRRARVG
jgi:hypothetical protein